MLTSRSQHQSNRRRRGATILEFSLAFPILLLLLFAGIEFSRANVLINTAKIAAAEGARRGIVLGTTASEIEASVQGELSTVGVAHAVILVEPAVVTDDTKVISVGLSIPLDARNGYLAPRFFAGKFVQKVSTIPREAKNDPQMNNRLSAAHDNMMTKLKAKTAGNGN